MYKRRNNTQNNTQTIQEHNTQQIEKMKNNKTNLKRILRNTIIKNI
jgi:hypothetical protein